MSHVTAHLSRRALVVEDDAAIRELLRLHLSRAGFDVTEAADGSRALADAQSNPFDLILLDVMLPGVDGIALCRAIRGKGCNQETAILMLTARDTESDKVLGLESGADDYMTKPFGVRELMARVGAILRRQSSGDFAEEPVSAQARSRDVVLDGQKRHSDVRGQPVELTKQEFDLLYQLVSHPGIVFSRAALLAKVWGSDTYVTERTVDTVVSRLRRKIERDAQDPELILTAWGVGYKFVDGG
jgi:DNA-binding response OmpR family regulator